MSDRGVFVRQRSAYELGASLVARPQSTEIPSGFREAEPAVGTAPHPVSIVVVLAVILPEAHGAVSNPPRSSSVKKPQHGHRYGPSSACLRTLTNGVTMDGIFPPSHDDHDPIDMSCPVSWTISLGSQGYLGLASILSCGGET